MSRFVVCCSRFVVGLKRVALRRFLFFFPLFFFCAQFVFSQEVDTTEVIEIKPITYYSGFRGLQEQHAPDTGLARVHYYDPVDNNAFLHRNTGALGTASFRMAGMETQQEGFRVGYEQFNLYRFTKHTIPFYNNQGPFTRLDFLIGLKREQTAHVTHSQNIGKKFNLGFHYLRYATTGLYVNQRTRHNDLAFTTTFDSKKRYLLQSIFILNNIRAEENGGVAETNIFEDTSFVSKELVKVSLENAENKQREIMLHAYQSIGLGKRLPNDSTRYALQFYQEVDVGREQYDYSDSSPDSAYYGMFYAADAVSDSFRSEARKVFIGTRAGIRKVFQRALVADLSASYTYNFFYQDNYSELRLQYADAVLSLESDTGSAFLYGARGAWSFLDYNKNDIHTKAHIGYAFRAAGVIKLSVTYTQAEPAALFNRFSFGNTFWVNNFEKQKQLTAELAYQLPKYSLHAAVRLQQVKDFLFWDENLLPAQHSGSLSLLMFEVRKLFTIKHFGIDNVIRVQFVSDKNLLRFPVYWGVHSFFYERGVFKNKLLTRIGVDIRYNTNYKAPGYFPLTGQLYLQNEQTLAFYPVLDFYLCFKVKTVRIFFKMQHLNQGMFKDKGYFAAYKYPAGDRTFRFGVSWMFLD